MAVLLLENKRLLEEHEKLRAENASLKRDLHEEHQSPPASLDVPPDLQQEIQQLLKTANDS